MRTDGVLGFDAGQHPCDAAADVATVGTVALIAEAAHQLGPCPGDARQAPPGANGRRDAPAVFDLEPGVAGARQKERRCDDRTVRAKAVARRTPYIGSPSDRRAPGMPFSVSSARYTQL